MQPFGLLIAGFSFMPCDHHGESAVMPARRKGVNVRHDEGITTALAQNSISAVDFVVGDARSDVLLMAGT
jgi:hypothetical protein